MNIDGIINAIKPAGTSSFAVVSRIRSLSGVRRVGHAGILDRGASGVLPVCIGRATRVIQFMLDARKSYRARVLLGITTDTYDADGSIVAERDCSGVNRRRLEEIISAFIGRIDQVPPVYSALKKDGTRLHRLARAGVDVDLEPRKVDIYGIDLTCWEPPHFSIDVECGRGTYIRSLAHDIGSTLGCGAHLVSLVRTRYGVFDIADGFTLDVIESSFAGGDSDSVINPVDSVLQHMPAAVFDDKDVSKVRNGISFDLDVDAALADGWCRAYSAHGNLIALLKYDRQKDSWHPDKVLI